MTPLGRSVHPKDRGAFLLEPLPWDSRHFGLSMGRLTLPSEDPADRVQWLFKLLEEAERMGLAQLMVRVRPNQPEWIHALEKVHFRLMDSLVTLGLHVDEAHAAESPLRLSPRWVALFVREATEMDVEALEAIAKEAFSDRTIWLDRFHADPHIPKAKADELYAQWIRNSVIPPSPSERMADCTWVAVARSSDGQEAVAGFLTLLKGGSDPDRPGKVSLNAVARPFRQMGIYGQLVRRAVEWFKEEGVKWVTVRTSIWNWPVQRTWIRWGAFPIDVEHTFHWWKSDH